LQEATGTYEQVLWNATCCNEKTNEFWGIMKTIFGWRAKATLGTTIGYFTYWVCLSIAIVSIIYYGRKKDAKELELDEKQGSEKSNVEILDKDSNV